MTLSNTESFTARAVYIAYTSAQTESSLTRSMHLMTTFALKGAHYSEAHFADDSEQA